jgi:VanZ family protein
MALPRSNILFFRTALFVALLVIMHLATTKIDYSVVDNLNDKFSHILAFYTLALLVDFAFPDSRFTSSKVLTLLGYGLMIECIQYFLPYRTFSLLDLAADAVGLIGYRASLPALKYAPWLRLRWSVGERASG